MIGYIFMFRVIVEYRVFHGGPFGRRKDPVDASFARQKGIDQTSILEEIDRGRIRCSSTATTGTQFEVTFPVAGHEVKP